MRFKKYLKAVTLPSIFAFVLGCLLMSLKFGIWRGLIAGLFLGLIVSLLVICVFIPVDYFITRKLPPEALSVRQKRRLHIKGDIDSVFDKTFEIVKGFKFIKKIEVSEERQIISVRTKVSIASFGEDIALSFKPSNGESDIYISSHPVVFYTLLDFGKNFRNVEQLSKTFTEHFHS